MRNIDPYTSVFEPAELERQTLQAAIEVFNSGGDKKGRKIFSQKRLETFDDLVKEVKRAAEEWEAKTGRTASKKAMDLIGKLDNYKNILALFPSQSMLTSTFSAALKVLITVRHTSTLE
jgi:phosphopantetheinyl transferase (holo-ACP synthase)